MAAPELHGQADRFTVSPSEGICFTITCRGASSFETQLLRLKGSRREEANPELGGTAVRSSINARYERRRHGIRRRPYLEVPGSENAFSGVAGVTFGAFIRSDAPTAAQQAVLTAWDTSMGAGFGIFLQKGMLTLLADDGDARMELSIPEPLQPGIWYEVAASYDLASGLGALSQKPCSAGVGSRRLAASKARKTRTTTDHCRLAQLPPAPIMIGASAKLTSHWTAAEESFRGTLESPYAIANATRASDLPGLHARRLDSPALLAAWDFSQGLSDDGIHPDEVPDITGSFDARCVNAPLRAVQGHLGNAIENFRTAPERYGAIRLLDRQPDAERWQSQITLAVPESLESGFYAVRICTANTEEYVPFVVSPPRQPTLQRPDGMGRTRLSSAHEAKSHH